ncbi:MAG: hypothetical protein ACR2GE_02960 [Pseudonocardia sp.]
MTAVAIVLAVLGAGCFAVAARLQHSAVSTAAGPQPLRFTAAARLIREPRWLGGLALLGAGAGLHATALVLAPVAVVQPIGVLAVPISVVLAARAARVPLDRAVMLGAASSTVGVAAFVALTASSAVAEPLAPYTELRVGLLVAVGVLVLGGLGMRARGRLRCLAFAGGAGVSFGFVSVLLRAASQRLQAGEVSGLDDPLIVATALAIAAGLLLGGWFVQLAYQSGPAELVIGSLTVVDPLVAVGLGIGLLGEGARTTPWTGAAELVCAAAAVIGVLVLARYHPEAVPPPRQRELTSPIGERA